MSNISYEESNASKYLGWEFSEEDKQFLTLLLFDDCSNSVDFINDRDKGHCRSLSSDTVSVLSEVHDMIHNASTEIYTYTEINIADEEKRTADRTPAGTTPLQKTKRKKCIAPGCSNLSRVGGVCVRHGARQQRCNYSLECSNVAVKGGVCTKHGAVRKNKRCRVLGCNKEAKKGGICYAHGAKRKKCFIPECNNVVVKGGACNKHGTGFSEMCQPCNSQI